MQTFSYSVFMSIYIDKVVKKLHPVEITIVTRSIRQGKAISVIFALNTPQRRRNGEVS